MQRSIEAECEPVTPRGDASRGCFVVPLRGCHRTAAVSGVPPPGCRLVGAAFQGRAPRLALVTGRRCGDREIMRRSGRLTGDDPMPDAPEASDALSP